MRRADKTDTSIKGNPKEKKKNEVKKPTLSLPSTFSNARNKTLPSVLYNTLFYIIIAAISSKLIKR